jgi:tetratricopeptide (TPR) repeat protein
VGAAAGALPWSQVRARRVRLALRLTAWAALLGICALLLHDAFCSQARLDCQAAARRGLSSAESICREQYGQTHDPRDGQALAQALFARGELGGAAAIAQGLLLSPERPQALLLLGRVAQLEGRGEDAQRSLELAAEQLLRQGQWRAGVGALLEVAELMARRGRAQEGRAAVERARAVARQHDDRALVERCGEALRSVGVAREGSARGGPE